MSYVEVPAEALVKFLADHGFSEIDPSGYERVFARTNHCCKHCYVIVNSSLSIGADIARGCGEDAIRVMSRFERVTPRGKFGKTFYKARRLHRTGSVEKVLERLYERIKDAYRECNRYYRAGECFECRPQATASTIDPRPRAPR